jgi:hypothetical protein
MKIYGLFMYIQNKKGTLIRMPKISYIDNKSTAGSSFQVLN